MARYPKKKMHDDDVQGSDWKSAHEGKMISHVNEERGTSTSRIGTTFSGSHDLQMSPDRSFQFYKRIVDPERDEDDGDSQDVVDTNRLDKLYGLRSH